jgi:hypothetical protein
MTRHARMSQDSIRARRKVAEDAAYVVMRGLESAVIKVMAERYLVQDGIDAQLRGIGVEWRMRQRVEKIREWLLKGGQ